MYPYTEGSKTEAIHFPRPGQEASAADTEEIEIDDHRFISFCLKFKYLRIFSCLNSVTVADITQQISQASRLSNSMNRHVFSNKKIRMDIRRRLYTAIVVNIALWGSESWALNEENRSKLEMFRHSCLCRMCK
jgi:hypothetical protein